MLKTWPIFKTIIHVWSNLYSELKPTLKKVQIATDFWKTSTKVDLKKNDAKVDLWVIYHLQNSLRKMVASFSSQCRKKWKKRLLPPPSWNLKWWKLLLGIMMIIVLRMRLTFQKDKIQFIFWSSRELLTEQLSAYSNRTLNWKRRPHTWNPLEFLCA